MMKISRTAGVGGGMSVNIDMPSRAERFEKNSGLE